MDQKQEFQSKHEVKSALQGRFSVIDVDNIINRYVCSYSFYNTKIYIYIATVYSNQVARQSQVPQLQIGNGI